MIRHAAHGRALFQTAVLACQRQLQLFGHELCVLEKHLVKISETEKENASLVFFFELQILLHHRGQRHPVRSFRITTWRAENSSARQKLLSADGRSRHRSWSRNRCSLPHVPPRR